MNTVFTCRLAEVNVRVSALRLETKEFCREYLTEGVPDFAVEIFPEDIAAERERSIKTSLAELGEIVPYEDDYLETLALYRKIAEKMVNYQTLLFHGSAIGIDGEAYLFTARSGTGKSTHTRLWREQFGARTLMVNDDKPLLRIKEDGVWVYGTPWDGKHHLSCNTALPLKAICALERSEENHIQKESLKKFVPVALQQIYLPDDPEAMLDMLGLIEGLLSRVGLYRLGCNMDPEAAIVAYEGMQN